MPRLRAKLFGEFRLSTGDGREIRVRAGKARALFAYLALNADRQHSREKLANLLWGTHGEDHARQNLRKCLSVLRRDLAADGSGVLSTSGAGIVFNGAAVAVDVNALKRGVKANRLKEALENYSGCVLLEGCTVTEDAFERWLALERASLNEFIGDAIYAFAKLRARENDTEAAIELAKRLVKLDPYREEGHRLLMRLYRRIGRRTTALRQYQICATILKKEFGVAPAFETRELFDTIKIPRPGRNSASSRPGIAIRRLESLTGDDRGDNFARGITEELVTELSRYRWFSVLPEDGAELDVQHQCPANSRPARFLLDGGVRHGGGRIRVTARLIHCASGRCIWADRLDHGTDDPLNTQLEIARRIAAQIIPEITEFESRETPRGAAPRTDAWSLWQKGLFQFFHFRKANTSIAKGFFLRSIEMDPEFSPAYASLALVEEHAAIFEHIEPQGMALGRGYEMARRAVSLDPRDGFAHYVLGRMFIRRDDIGAAIVEMETAMALCPSFALVRHGYGVAKYYDGQPKEAVQEFLSAARLSPADPERWGFYHMRARSHFDLGEYEQALEWSGRAVRQPNAKIIALATHAASAWQLGHAQKARTIVRQLVRRDPTFTADYVFRNFGNANISSEIGRFAETMQKAGLS